MANHKKDDPRNKPLTLNLNTADRAIIDDAWRGLGYSSRTSFIIAAATGAARESVTPLSVARIAELTAEAERNLELAKEANVQRDIANKKLSRVKSEYDLINGEIYKILTKTSAQYDYIENLSTKISNLSKDLGNYVGGE
jgi:uncharacterized protein (DUF1778 family)